MSKTRCSHCPPQAFPKGNFQKHETLVFQRNFLLCDIGGPGLDPCQKFCLFSQIALKLHRHGVRRLSVITQSDGLLVTLGDGRYGKDLQQNGTRIAADAVLALGG